MSKSTTASNFSFARMTLFLFYTYHTRLFFFFFKQKYEHSGDRVSNGLRNKDQCLNTPVKVPWRKACSFSFSVCFNELLWPLETAAVSFFLSVDLIYITVCYWKIHSDQVRLIQSTVQSNRFQSANSR